MYIFLACPAGSYINSGNSDSCDVCSENTYSNTANANTCTACPTGTDTQGQTGATVCGMLYNLILGFMNYY